MSALALALVLLAFPSPSPGALLTDDFGAGERVTGEVVLVGSNVTATAQPGEPAHFAEPAQHSVWLRWSPAVDATYSISTSNSPLDTVLAVYVGNTLANLKPVVTNDDIDFRTLGSWLRFRAYRGETFHIAVDGAGGAVGRFELRVYQGGPAMAAWTAATPTGTVMDSGDFQAPLLLFDFWETTCGACVDELYELFKIQRAYGPRGLQMVGVAIDPDAKVVNNFILEYPMVYPHLMSSPGALGALNNGQPIGPPTKFLVDRERRIVGRFEGGLFPVSSTVAYYAGYLEPLLRSTSIPKLEIERLGSQVRVSWPDGVVPSDLRLESGAQADGPAWQPVSAARETNAGRFRVTLPAQPVPQFFRLRQP